MNVRFLFSLTLAWSLIVGPCSFTALAQKTGIPAEHHSWGRFKPGAWKLVRVLTEALDENGLVTSTSSTKTKTTLISVDKDGVTLEVKVEVETSGTQFESQPEIRRLGFHGEICEGEGVKITDSGAGFDLGSQLADHSKNGLHGIRERVTVQGGVLATETAPGRGTRLTVQLPAGSEKKASGGGERA